MKKTKFVDIDKMFKILLVFWFGTLGLNVLLVSLYYSCQSTSQYSTPLMIIGILMLVVAIVAVFDTRKSNNNLSSVILTGLMHAACTIFFIAFSTFYELAFVYLAELLFAVLIIRKFYRH